MNTTERRRTTDLRPIQTAAGLLRASDLSALRYIVENARYAGVLGCLRREGDDAVLRRLERAGCLEGGLQWLGRGASSAVETLTVTDLGRQVAGMRS